MKNYTIKVLSNKDFDYLPYTYSKEALGVADPKTNTAYVRYSASHDLQKYLIDHELDHFVEEHPTDEIEGVRYKIPILGPLASGIGKVAGGIGQGISSFGGGVMNSFGNAVSSQNTSGSGNKSFLGNLGGSLGGALGNFATPKNLLGAGALGLGLMKKYPKVPDLMTPQIQSLQGQVRQGGSPIGQQAQGVISGNLSKQFNPLTDQEITAATADIDRSRLMAIKRLEGTYASLRPGTDYTSDTNYKMDLADIERNFTEQKSNTVANRTRAAEDTFNSNQYRNIQAGLGASDQQMSQLYQIAQLDIQRIMAQLQLDAQQAQMFKDTFLDLGSSLLNPQPNLMELFRPLPNSNSGGQ